MDYNKILDEVGYPPEYSREKAIDAMYEVVIEKNNRIAELEETLQRLCFLNNAEMEGIRPPHPGDCKL